MKGLAALTAFLCVVLGVSAQQKCTVVKDSAFYLSLSVNQLYSEATKGRRVGDCYIAEAKRGSCDLYVKSAIKGVNGDRGWPKTNNPRVGTGCVRAPDLPKGVRTCYYNDPRYQLTALERKSFCTDTGKVNAVAQLKHAIRNKACKLPSIVKPVPCMRGSPRCKCTTTNTCHRPRPSQSWAISSLVLDRVRRCRNKRFFCNSVVVRNEYNVFSSHAKRQQKKLFLSQVNVPPRASTRNIVFIVAGQQTQKGPFVPKDGQDSGLTGQNSDFGKRFNRKTGSVGYTVRSNSLVNEILRTGMFSKADTFVGMVFDARFNYEFRRNRKDRIVGAYLNYLVAKLGAAPPRTIYLAGHSRGGCLVMRLAQALTARYPQTRIIVHNYDGVCSIPGSVSPTTKSEFGVGRSKIRNPLNSNYEVATTNIASQLPRQNCLAVRSFLSGEKVILKAVRSFGHFSFRETSNSLFTPNNFPWYTQTFYNDKHHAISYRHHALARNHLLGAFQSLPCSCGSS